MAKVGREKINVFKGHCKIYDGRFILVRIFDSLPRGSNESRGVDKGSRDMISIVMIKI